MDQGLRDWLARVSGANLDVMPALQADVVTELQQHRAELDRIENELAELLRGTIEARGRETLARTTLEDAQAGEAEMARRLADLKALPLPEPGTGEVARGRQAQLTSLEAELVAAKDKVLRASTALEQAERDHLELTQQQNDATARQEQLKRDVLARLATIARPVPSGDVRLDAAIVRGYNQLCEIAGGPAGADLATAGTDEIASQIVDALVEPVRDEETAQPAVVQPVPSNQRDDGLEIAAVHSAANIIPQFETLQVEEAAPGGQRKNRIARLLEALPAVPDTPTVNWIKNTLHVGARHGGSAFFSILLRELVAHRAAKRAEQLSDETTATIAGVLVGASILSNVAAMGMHEARGTATSSQRAGHFAQAITMAAVLATAKLTDTLKDLMPAAAKFAFNAAVRDLIFNYLFSINNNQGSLREPNFKAMTADSIAYAGAFLLPTFLQYYDQTYSGNDGRLLGESNGQLIKNSALFAAALSVPEWLNGLTYPVAVSQLGDKVPQAVAGGEETNESLANLKLRMEMPKPTLQRLADQWSGLFNARLVFTTAITGFLNALATYVTEEEHGKPAYMASQIGMSTALCLILYYQWILSGMTAEPQPATMKRRNP